MNCQHFKDSQEDNGKKNSNDMLRKDFVTLMQISRQMTGGREAQLSYLLVTGTLLKLRSQKEFLTEVQLETKEWIKLVDGIPRRVRI